MCGKIVIVDELTGEITNSVSTVGDLKKLGIDPIFNKTGINSFDVSCLCGVDIEKTAKYNGFSCSTKNDVHTFVYDNLEKYLCDICGELDCDGTCEDYCPICGEDDCDGECDSSEFDDEDEDDEDEDEDDGIQFSEWMPVQWPDSGNWFVSNGNGKTVCVFNNENVDTKEAAELVAYAPEMLHLLQTYYLGKNDGINNTIARNILKKFKMVD